ncbi:MAG: AI-2E family transporter [Bacteroidetes bacterium]|nr:MAG: AI-2E family transporter [Bacteroidota bacterium]RLE06055.1 MAG: AI-2E family transporter [Bacteroidota bacterium]
MTNKPDRPDNLGSKYVNIAFDLILKMGTLFLVILLCFKILKPFLGMLIWGLIIAIILFPVFERLRNLLGKRNKLSSILLTVVALSILILPSIWLVNQLVEGLKFLAGNIQGGDLSIPPPTESVADWPIIGEWLYDNWLQLSENMEESLRGFMPQIVEWGEKTLGTLANTGLGVLQFAASIIIAGIFLIFFEKGSDSGRKIFQKVVGARGDEFLEISLQTIRNVTTGVLGVAVIQTTLMGLGLILANVPLAAVWIVLILVMTIAQLPVLLFNIPLIIYLFAFMDPLPAVLWTLYFLVMGMIDNILKPLLMGKGLNVPMLVIFLGALGGFMAFGFIGLFLGSIVLSLAYKLYLTWVNSEPA